MLFNISLCQKSASNSINCTIFENHWNKSHFDFIWRVFFGKWWLAVKQSYQTCQLSIRQKLFKNAKIWILDLNETFFGDFQTLSKYAHSIQLEKVKREKKNWVDVKVFPYPTCDKVLKKISFSALDPPRHWCCHKEVHCKMEKTSSWPSK